MMGRLAVGNIPRNQAFAAATLHGSLIDDITLLGLILQFLCFIGPGWAGLGGGVQVAVGTAHRAAREEDTLCCTAASATTPGCTSKCPSWLPYKRKAASRQRGLNVFLNTFSYFPHQSMEDATDSKTGVNNGVCKSEAITVILGEMTAKSLTLEQETKYKK